MFSIKFRIPIIVFLISITIFLGLGLKKMSKESGVEALIPLDNNDYVFFKDMEEEFGFTDQIVIGFTFKDSVYQKENLSLLRDLTNYFITDDYIDEDDITAISTIDNIDGIDQELIIEPLLPEDDLITDLITESTKIKIRDNAMLKNKIVSKDEKSSVIIITVSTDVSMDAEILSKLINRVNSKLDTVSSQRPNVKIYRSGMVSVKHITSEYMSKDMSVMFPIAIIVVIAILIILLRSFSGVLMPLLVTLFSIIWTLGLKGWLQSPMTITETVIPVMLIAIGCADGVHIVSEFLTYTRSGLEVKSSIIKVMSKLKTPVILTSITTSLGFFSLITAPGVSIKNMGIFLGFGVITAMLFSLLFIPAILSFKKEKKRVTVTNKQNLNLTPISNMIIKGRYILIGISILILTVSIVGMMNIKVETDQIKFLKDSDPLKIATDELQKELGGVNTLDIILTGNEGSFKKPQNLNFINKLEELVNSKEIVGYTVSINDYLKKINYEFNNKNPDYNRIPYETESIDGEMVAGQDIISNLLFLYEMGGGDTIDKVVNSDYSLTKISIRLLETSQIDIEEFIYNMDLWMAKNLPIDLSYRYSNDYMRIVMGKLITESQIKSFISTLIAIIILLMIIFRSPLSGFLTSLPVIIAVCFNFGIMWLTNTTLNIGTSIIASVGMGVGIDYAIHFFQRYKTVYSELNDNEQAIIKTINDSYKPILTNALAVGLGFLTLLFSNYFIIAEIGWITGISMLTTAVCALFILPAYLAVFEPLKKKQGGNTMKKGLIALFLLLPITVFADEKGEEIMLKNYNLTEAKNSYSITTMVLIDKKGKKKTRKMETYKLETSIGENQYIEFQLPADVKGTKFLTIGDEKKDDDQRIYLPALKKVRKISSSNKKGKFMGSDITYYDMDSKDFYDFLYTYLKDETIDENNYWVVISEPKKKDAPYSKVNNFISKSDNFIYKKEMFDKKGNHIKTINVVETRIINEIIIPVKTVVINHKDNHKTLLSISNIEVNGSIDESMFSIQNLK